MRYYPDFCVSEWVTVSGPTMDIPLTLKHQGCRIGFVAKAGNELQKAEICTDWQDYMWQDNSNTNSNDESTSEHGKTEAQARAEAAAVKAVYDQMCMPSGVDVETSVLTTMTKALYDATTDFTTIHAKTESDGIVKINVKTPEEIRNDVQRPVFCANDGRLYMVTIPYDMSNDAKSGEGLKLPACTRIKVWIYDVNDGDRTNTGEGYYEANYHVFTLGDVKDKNGTKYMFPDGMELVPGNSYMFSIGYHYDNLTITPADNFSWAEQEAEDGTGDDETQTNTATNTYTWWKKAIKEAIPKNISQSFQPEFHISTQAEFLEFINLVNGTAASQTSGLTQMPRPEKRYNKDNPVLESDYRWYRTSDIEGGKVIAGRDSVTHEVAISEGYIFYEHYHPANADQAAYSREDYLRGPYSFFDENLNRRFTVYLDKDLDFYDWKLTSIGNEDPSVELGATGSHPFRGIFDGQMHKLTNIYMDGGYMFKHCYDVAIRNLQIETVHDFKLVHTAQAANESTGFGAYIVGISIKAPSSGNPIATTLKGSSYVVGCIYQGRATGAMVGTANNLNMYANMMAAEGLAPGSGALLGAYASGSTAFFAPQTGKKPTWGRFMVNYYDTSLSPYTTAVGGVDDNYKPQEYIRGAHSYILKAKNDNLLSDEVPYERLTTPLMIEGYYGLAPWKALNYALWMYNSVGSEVSEAHNCQGHFENNTVGYAHTYPRLVSGPPTAAEVEGWNVLEQNN